MKQGFWHGRRTIGSLVLYVFLGFAVFCEVPSYVAWRICDFPAGTFSDATGSFYPCGGDKAVVLIEPFLFVTDGTPEGTYTITGGVYQIPGLPRTIVQYKDHGYFRKAYTPGLYGLGRTNYEPGQDELVWEPVSGPEGNNLLPAAVIGEYLLFVHGRALYRTDGSPAGTECIYDFSGTYEFPSTGLFFNNLVKEGGYLFFVAGDTTGTHGVWRTDGTPAGTINLAQRSSAPLAVHAGGNGIVYFSERPSTGCRLWKTDGTPQGTTQLSSFPYQSPFGTSYIISSSYGSGRLWFGVTPLNELWSSTGTFSGTRKIITFPPPPVMYGHQLARMRSVGDRLLFTISEGLGTYYLWGTDGTEQGTAKLLNPETGEGWGDIFFYGRLEESILFGAGHSPNHVIWLSDGTAAGTRQLAPGVHTFESPFKFRDYYLMVAKDTETPVGLWGLRKDEPFQFLAQPRPRQHYYEGDPLDLFVQVPAWSEPMARYQWYKDGVPLPGEETNELFVGMLSPADGGRYFCRVILGDEDTFHDSAIAYVRVFEEGSLPLTSPLTLAVLLLSLVLFGWARLGRPSGNFRDIILD